MANLMKHLALAGTGALGFSAVLTMIDIVLRSVSDMTVFGLVDIVQLCVMVGAMMAIPYGFVADQHVSIDIFTSRLPARVQAGLRIFSALLGAIFLAGVFWFSFAQMRVEYGYGDRSMSIGIPMVWYWIPLLASVALSAVANLYLIIVELRSKRAR